MNLGTSHTRSGLVVMGLSWLVAACSGDAPPDATQRPRYVCPACARPDEAPRRLPDGAHTCVRVGAAPTTGTATWPDATGATEPVVYVRSGATGGTGTREAPFGDLAAALAATPRPGTVLVAGGTIAVPQTLELSRSVALRGVGATGTILTGPAGAAVVRVVASDPAGEPVAVTLAQLGVRPTTAGTFGIGTVTVEGAGATLTLRDVAVALAGDGVSASRGATLCAERLTVERAAGHGVLLDTGAMAFLREVLVRDGARVGVLSHRAHLDIEGGRVSGHTLDGVAVLGARLGSMCSTPADCAAPSPCPGFTFAQDCVAGQCRSKVLLRDVAVLDNRSTGLRAEQSSTLPGEAPGAVLARPGPDVEGTRLVVCGTRTTAAREGGDGLYVGPSATVALDRGVTGDANRGHASEFVGNARAGVLVSGTREPAAGTLQPNGRLEVSGARLASNQGPGMFVQQRAEVSQLAFSEAADNGALGVGVASGGAIPLLLCNQFIGTRTGTLVDDLTRVSVTVGDGLSMSEGIPEGTRAAMIQGNEFSDNTRFGLVLNSFTATLAGDNRGSGNGFGVGSYGSTLTGTSPGTILGRASPPGIAPTATGRLTVTTPTY